MSKDSDLNKSWATLNDEWKRLKPQHLRDMFSNDPNRFSDLSCEFEDFLFNFSCERLDQTALSALFDLARAADLEEKRDAMFAGASINTTEDRAVMHVALRANADDGYSVDGQKTAELVDPVREAFLAFADDVRDGRYKNAKGDAFTDVVNVGIGGSDLGPVMAVRALSEYRENGPNVHFVSNVDGAHLRDVTSGLNPETTLILVASKTFTTIETITNAKAAKAWLQTKLSADEANANLVALSTNLEATAEFGIPSERVFGFWDWVGGRYSMCSSIGLSIALAVGSENFRDLLAGFRAMDLHFKSAPLEENIPVLMALIGIWRRNVMGAGSVALLPYDQRLEFFPSYVQQMDMESNGKRVNKLGGEVARSTSPVIWGTPGTNSQHSYFQMLHQGTDPVPADFIIAAQSNSDLEDQHTLLTANFLAQCQALALGKTGQEVADEMRASGADEEKIAALVPHRTFPGNLPNSSIVYKNASPYALGRLIAAYEHKVFVQGAIWDVNSFDQWGVELGKVMAKDLQPMLDEAADISGLNASTKGLINHINRLK